MKADDVAAELEQPRAQELLETAGLCRLAYTGPDGLPRVIPIGFLWTGAAVVVCTSTNSPKVRALTARPEVAVTIDVGDTPEGARALLIRGVATLETVDGVAEEYLTAAAKTMHGERLTEFETAVRALYAQQVRITIAPRWARFYDFGAGRLPSFLTELIEKARN